MDSRPIIYMDSGIGGIPYCLNFAKRNPNESVHYLADRLNFPYGPRQQKELVEILSGLVGKLVADFNPKIIVLACNTATISAMDELVRRFPGLPFVGTIPEVKPAARESKAGRIGVIATERTIADPFTARLAGDSCHVTGIAAADLVDFVNNRFLSASEEEKNDFATKYTERFRAEGVDGIVLGCTHFLFLKEQFVKQAAPDIKVFDSVESVTQTAEALLDKDGGKLRAGGAAGKKPAQFLITGTEEADSLWQGWADYMGYAVSIFGKT
ncbi:MAG: glutamate racemase [Spirochaetes bacterium]|nr:glutamate racemase [Spirochaetota bacterium]